MLRNIAVVMFTALALVHPRCGWSQDASGQDDLVSLLPDATVGYVRIDTRSLWQAGVDKLLDRQKIDGVFTALEMLADEAAPLDLTKIDEVVIASLQTDERPPGLMPMGAVPPGVQPPPDEGP